MRGLLTTGVALAALILPNVARAQADAQPPAENAEPATPDVVTGDMPPPMPTDMPITEEQVDAALPPAEATASPAGGGQVYTPEDFEQMVAERRPIIEQALAEGVLLREAQPSGS